MLYNLVISIGGDETNEALPGGLPEEDEYVEAALVAANKVYEVQEDSLVPVPDSWGQMPKIEILASDKVNMFRIFLYCNFFFSQRNTVK